VTSCSIPQSLPTSLSIPTLIRAYGRNAAVGVPTFVGNTLGFTLSLPVYLPALWFVRWRYDPKQAQLIDKKLDWIWVVPVYAFGGVFGTPFLPLGYLGAEDREWICVMC
jgi:hypothetical protein